MRKSISRAARKLAAATNVPAVIETEATPATVETTDLATVNAGNVIDNETGETVAPVATAATPDKHAERRAAVAADRAAVFAVYAGFNARAVSIPVKPVSSFKPKAAVAHVNPRSPSVRQSAAIAVMLAASGNKLADGSTFPRIAEIDGKPTAIENGCAADMLRAGLVSVSGDTPATETFTILPKAAATILSHLGSKLARESGILA